MRTRTPLRTGLVGAAALCALASPAGAACLGAGMTTLAAHQGGQSGYTTEFATGEELVICVSAAETGHMAILDVPPSGESEQLLPNAIVGSGHSYAVEGGREYCFGTAETFPMYHAAEDGLGEGRVVIHWSPVPLQERAIVPVAADAADAGAEDCAGPETVELGYRVTAPADGADD